MNRAEFFIIEYLLHGEPKTFIIRATTMRSVDAWHWAACDAGLAPIPKPGRPPLKVVSKPLAERHGLTDVKWRESAKLEWVEV
jgi:hypothetical protein